MRGIVRGLAKGIGEVTVELVAMHSVEELGADRLRLMEKYEPRVLECSEENENGTMGKSKESVLSISPTGELIGTTYLPACCCLYWMIHTSSMAIVR